MSDSGQEIEAKFYVRDLERIRKSLDSLGAHVIQPRVLEINLRFDLPDGSLRRDGRVLRLRRDSEAKLTYKGDGKNNEGILSREEIEFVVEDFEKAQRFLGIKNSCTMKNIVPPMNGKIPSSCSTKCPLAILSRSKARDWRASERWLQN